MTIERMCFEVDFFVSGRVIITMTLDRQTKKTPMMDIKKSSQKIDFERILNAFYKFTTIKKESLYIKVFYPECVKFV